MSQEVEQPAVQESVSPPVSDDFVTLRQFALHEKIHKLAHSFLRLFYSYHRSGYGPFRREPEKRETLRKIIVECLFRCIVLYENNTQFSTTTEAEQVEANKKQEEKTKKTIVCSALMKQSFIETLLRETNELALYEFLWALYSFPSNVHCALYGLKEEEQYQELLRLIKSKQFDIIEGLFTKRRTIRENYQWKVPLNKMVIDKLNCKDGMSIEQLSRMVTSLNDKEQKNVCKISPSIKKMLEKYRSSVAKKKLKALHSDGKNEHHSNDNEDNEYDVKLQQQQQQQNREEWMEWGKQANEIINLLSEIVLADINISPPNNSFIWSTFSFLVNAFDTDHSIEKNKNTATQEIEHWWCDTSLMKNIRNHPALESCLLVCDNKNIATD